MKEIIISILGGIFRYLLVAIATLLVARGVVTKENADALLNHPELSLILSGLAVFTATSLWMFYNKLRTRLKIETALELPAGSSPAELKEAVKEKTNDGNVMVGIILATALLLSSCTMTTQQKARWSATGAVVVQRVATIALNTVVAAAMSQTDKENKANLLDSLAEAFWTQPIVSSKDVEMLVDTWTEDKSHWVALGDELAVQYVRGADPVDIAEGLSNAAEAAR